MYYLCSKTIILYNKSIIAMPLVFNEFIHYLHTHLSYAVCVLYYQIYYPKETIL